MTSKEITVLYLLFRLLLDLVCLEHKSKQNWVTFGSVRSQWSFWACSSKCRRFLVKDMCNYNLGRKHVTGYCTTKRFLSKVLTKLLVAGGSWIAQTLFPKNLKKLCYIHLVHSMHSIHCSFHHKWVPKPLNTGEFFGMWSQKLLKIQLQAEKTMAAP